MHFFFYFSFPLVTISPPHYMHEDLFSAIFLMEREFSICIIHRLFLFFFSLFFLLLLITHSLCFN
jgi:hypothetical protein